MGLGTPLICSDIRENTYITKDNATTFHSGDASSLCEALKDALDHPVQIKKNAENGQKDIRARFNWETITDDYIKILERVKRK